MISSISKHTVSSVPMGSDMRARFFRSLGLCRLLLAWLVLAGLPAVDVWVESATVSESVDRVDVLVRLSEPAPTEVVVDLVSVPGTASDDCGWMPHPYAGAIISASPAPGLPLRGIVTYAEPGRAVFAPGESVYRVPLRVASDRFPEANETIGLQITQAVGATVTQALATITIVDDDTEGPIVRVDPAVEFVAAGMVPAIRLHVDPAPTTPLVIAWQFLDAGTTVGGIPFATETGFTVCPAGAEEVVVPALAVGAATANPGTASLVGSLVLAASETYRMDPSWYSRIERVAASPTVQVIAATPRLNPGATIVLAADVRDADGGLLNVPVTWQADRGQTINAQGAMTLQGVENGVVTVTATANIAGVPCSGTASLTINQAPLIVQGPEASPEPRWGEQILIRVVGDDDAPAGQLTYTWSGTTPDGQTVPTEAFQPNGTTGAGTTVLRLPALGSSTVSCTVTDAEGRTATAATTVERQVIRLDVGASIAVPGAILDQFGDPLVSAVQWSVTGDGAISPEGVLTAAQVPGGSGTVTMSDGSGTLIDRAAFRINGPPVVDAVTVTWISPTTALIDIAARDPDGRGILGYTYTATGPGTMSFEPPAAVSQTQATVTRTGTYTVTVTAVNAAGVAASASTTTTCEPVATTLQILPAATTPPAWVATVPWVLDGALDVVAEVRDQCGDAMTSPTVSWSATGGVTIDDAGHVEVVAAEDGVITATSGAVQAQVPVRARLEPEVTWPDPATIIYGTPLTAAQLNAQAVVAGTWTYTPAAGTLLDAGTHTLTATFAPANTVNFRAATTLATLVVAQATPTLAWTPPAPIGIDEALSAAQLNPTASFGGQIATGTWTFTPALGSRLPAGPQILQATFAPTDAANLTAASIQVTIQVLDRAPTITVAPQVTPSPITGQAGTLAVSAVDDGGATGLTYQWTSTGPAAVQVAPNGTADAQAAVATFAAAGSYTITVTVTDAAGQSASAAVPVDVVATPTLVTVTPAAVTIAAGAQTTLTAAVWDQFNAVVSEPSGLVWGVTGDAAVAANGLEAQVTAVAGGGTATVTATLGTLSASSAITIQPSEQGTTVTIAATTPEATEGQADAPAILTVTRTGDVTAALTVAYTVSGTATPGSDYTTLSGVVAVPAGANAATIGVVALSDTAAEADETVVVTLGAGTGYAIGSPDTATAIIHSPVRPAVAFAAATSTVREDAGSVQIRVNLNRNTTVETRIGYAVTGGTATAGSDYTTVAGDVVFPAGSTTQVIAIPVMNDAISDPSETIVLTLAGPVGLDLGSQLVHTLTLKDTQATRLRVDALVDTIAENNAVGSAFRFSRTGEPSADLTFTVYWDGTAVAGTHFIENRPTSITIPAGQSAVDVAIVPIDNASIGDDVHLYLYISDVPAGTPVDQWDDYLYILDDEVPVLTGHLEPAQLYEGSASYLYMGWANEQGQPVARHTPVTIAWNISGTGIDTGDFSTPLSGTVTTYQDYAWWSSAYVTVRKDGVEEGPEPFLVTLTAGALSGQVTGTLNDLATIAITLSTATITEPATESAVFRFVRSGSTSGALTVPITWSYYTTATPGVDFVGILPSSIVFAAGQTEVTVPIQPIDDAVIESDKRVGLYVNGGTGFTITYPNGTPTLTILDDETPIVSVRLQPANIYEGSESYAYVGLRDANGQLITRASAQIITWQITGSQASDWSTSITGTLSTNPNYAYERAIYLAAVADGVEDGPEAFTLTAALGASSGQASGSILDRATITLSVSAPTVAEESGEEVRFVIERTGVTSQPTTVSLSWSSSATAGSDFSGTLPTSVTIPAGAPSAVVAITPINDAIVESDETLTLYVYSTTAYGVSGPSTVNTTILDDETPLLSTAFDYAINAEGQTAQCTFQLIGTNGYGITRQRSTVVAYALTGIDAADVNQPLSGTVTVPAGYQYGSCAIDLLEDGIAEGIETATFIATVGSSTASTSLHIIELDRLTFAPSAVQVQEPGYGQTDVTAYASLTTGWEIPAMWEASVSMTPNEEGTASWYSYWNYGSAYDLSPYYDYWYSWGGVTDGSFSVPVAYVHADDVYEGGPQGISEQAYADLSAVTFRQGSLASPTFYLSRSKALTIAIQDKVHATIAIQSPTPQQTIVGSTVPVAFTVAADQPLQEVRVNGTVIASGSVTPGPMTATVTLPNLGANTIRIWVVSAQGAVVQATVGVQVLPATIPVIFVAPMLDADGAGAVTGAPVARAFAETAGESNLTLSATVEPEGQPAGATPAITTWDGQYIQVNFGEQAVGRYVLRLSVAMSDGSRSGTAVATIIYDPAGWTPDPTTNPIIIQHPQNGATLTAFGGQ
jgi:hypothetical protein